MADFGADVDLETFRADARAWLDANFPKSLSGKGSVMAAEGAQSGAPADSLSEQSASWLASLATMQTG